MSRARPRQPASTKSPTARLKIIAAIIEQVDDRCMAADGPVTPTEMEITLREIQHIYRLAKGTER